MKRSSPLTLKVLLFLSLFLNSCGYELRTYSSGLSSQTVHFEGDNSDLNLDLKNKLKEMNNVLRDNGKDSDLKIKKGRHPVIEQQLESIKNYIPNDISLDQKQQQLI